MVYRSSRAPGSSGPFQDDGRGLRPHNVFRNDGSFLEMFKKMQEQTTTTTDQSNEPIRRRSSGSEPETSPHDGPGGSKSPVADPRPVEHSTIVKPSKTTPFVGKRRGGRVLPTGQVKRVKPDPDADEEIPKDAWSAYLAEVKRYKETTCEEDTKTRPLVK